MGLPGPLPRDRRMKKAHCMIGSDTLTLAMELATNRHAG
jgi:hypothetical protein